MGIEPTLSAWEADVLPLNHTRAPLFILMDRALFVKIFSIARIAFRQLPILINIDANLPVENLESYPRAC